MNYSTLKNKLQLINSEKPISLSSISNLSSYFHIIHNHYTIQYSSLKDQFKDNISPIDETISTSNLSSSISSLHSSFKQMNSKAQKLLDQLSLEIITPLDNFHKSQSQIYNDISINFQALLDHITKTQSSLDNSKFIYYYSCVLSNQKCNETNQRLHLTKKNNENIYQYEYSNYTKIISKSNLQYEKLIDNYKQNEESRIFFIKSIIDKYTQIISEYQDIVSKMISIINELFSTKVCQDELQSIINRLDFDKKNSDSNSNRILIEKYVSFEEYSKSTKEELNSTFNFEIIASSETTDEEKLHYTILNVKEQLLNNDTIDISSISLLIKYLRNNPIATGNLFLDAFADNEWYQCLNHSNFNFILTLVLFIDNSVNKDKQDVAIKKNKDITDAQYALVLERHLINKKIVNFSQKIYYQQEYICNNSTSTITNSQKVKKYLCALLSKKDTMFSSKAFWKEMFNMTIANKLNNHLSSALSYVSSSSIKQSQNEENDIESSQVSISHMSRARTLISYASTSVSSSIISRIWPNNDIRTKGVIYKTKVSSYIPNYSKLSINDINSIEEIAIDTIKNESLIKEFIICMANFNYPIEKMIELITEIGEEARLSKDMINYYISFCNVNWYTIKRYIINGIDTKAYYYMKNYRFTSKEKRIQLIAFGLDYLEWKDYYSLLQLNKSGYKKLSNKIFKKALQKTKLPFEIRLKIWYSILKVVSHHIYLYNTQDNLRKTYIYSSLTEKASLKLDEKTKQLIEVDIPRTYISPSLDKDKTKKAIHNILFAMSQISGDGKYCQGMNFIAQFLYEITQDEEKAFNVFLGIFKSTEYSLIFGQDLLKFKILFYVFHRLLALYEPEISALFKISKSDVYYFLAPCFYPLFQNSREFIKDKGIPIVLLRILDGFITSGWIGMMKVGLNLLNYASDDIIKMNNDQLYEFITSKIFAIDFFENKSINQYEFLQKKKIPKKLIEYIEQEYIQKIALKENEKDKERERESKHD